MKREIVLDTETTGFDPKRGDRLVEIGCIELIDLIPSGEKYHVYINPERDMPASAEAVHGLSDDFLSDKPLFSEIAGAFLAFIKDSPLVIHNAPFDMGFIDFELENCQLKPLGIARSVDTLTMARKRFPGLPNKLDDLIKRFNIDGSRRVKHGALLDAELLSEVYLELAGGRQATMTLGTASDEADPHVQQAGIRARQRPTPLPSRLDSEADKRHREFIKTLGGKALWLARLEN